MTKAFRGELTRKWREEHLDVEPAEKFLERIKAEKEKFEGSRKGRKNNGELPSIDPPYDLPEGWCWIRLGEITQDSTYGTSAKTNENADGVPVLRMGNIQDGDLVTANLKYLPIDHEDVQNLKLEIGDLLFNRTNSYELVGKTAVVKSEEITKMTFASYLVRIRLLSKELLSNYVCHYINSKQGREYLLAQATQQVGQANLNPTKLLMMPLPLPPESELIVINSIVERCLNFEKQFHRHLDFSILPLTQSILSKAFRGELGTNNPEEECALELLKQVLISNLA